LVMGALLQMQILTVKAKWNCSSSTHQRCSMSRPTLHNGTN
jgi:hypothetical protein